MTEPFAVPVSGPLVTKAVGTVMGRARFQVRSVLWGNRRRYEVVDTRTDTTLVVRATSEGADDDVMVLNMGGTGGPPVDAAEVVVAARS